MTKQEGGLAMLKFFLGQGERPGKSRHLSINIGEATVTEKQELTDYFRSKGVPVKLSDPEHRFLDLNNVNSLDSSVDSSSASFYCVVSHTEFLTAIREATAKSSTGTEAKTLTVSRWMRQSTHGSPVFLTEYDLQEDRYCYTGVFRLDFGLSAGVDSTVGRARRETFSELTSTDHIALKSFLLSPEYCPQDSQRRDYQKAVTFPCWLSFTRNNVLYWVEDIPQSFQVKATKIATAGVGACDWILDVTSLRYPSVAQLELLRSKGLTQTTCEPSTAQASSQETFRCRWVRDYSRNSLSYLVSLDKCTGIIIPGGPTWGCDTSRLTLEPKNYAELTSEEKRDFLEFFGVDYRTYMNDSRIKAAMYGKDLPEFLKAKGPKITEATESTVKVSDTTGSSSSDFKPRWVWLEEQKSYVYAVNPYHYTGVINSNSERSCSTSQNSIHVLFTELNSSDEVFLNSVFWVRDRYDMLTLEKKQRYHADPEAKRRRLEWFSQARGSTAKAGIGFYEQLKSPTRYRYPVSSMIPAGFEDVFANPVSEESKDFSHVYIGKKPDLLSTDVPDTTPSSVNLIHHLKPSIS